MARNVSAGAETSCWKSSTCSRSVPNDVEPRGQEVGVATSAERHVLLVVGIAEVVGPESVGRGEILLDRVVGGEPQPDLLVGEEGEGTAHRLAEHDEHVRVHQPIAHRRRHRLGAVEVRRRRLEVHGAVAGVGEVALPHRGRRERLSVARREEVARLLDRRRRDVGMRRQRDEQRRGARLVDTRDDDVGALDRHWRLPSEADRW